MTLTCTHCADQWIGVDTRADAHLIAHAHTTTRHPGKRPAFTIRDHLTSPTSSKEPAA